MQLLERITKRPISLFQKRALWTYLTATLVALLALEIITKLYKIDLSIPLYYSDDSLFYFLLICGVTRGEWWPFAVPHTSHLGVPFGFSLHDFPASETNLILWTVKAMSFFTNDPFRIYNYHVLLNFFLILISSIYVFKYYRISNSIAIVFGIFYTFLPYHFYRYGGHLVLAYYFLVPLRILILTWIWSSKPIFFKLEQGKYRLDIKNYKSIFSIIVLLVSGATSIYYNFFFCFFAFLAGISAFFYRKSFHHLLVSFILIAIVVTSAVANLFPYIKYRIEHGTNVDALARGEGDAENYGLKIAQLILPIDDYRISWINEVKASYNTIASINENKSAAQGIVGSIGLFFLLFFLVFKTESRRTIYYKLGLLTLFAILLGIIGGFSALFVLLIFSVIRGYNRLSLFIAFFSYTALAFAINYYRRCLPKWLVPIGLAALLFIGLFDQTSPADAFTYSYKERRIDFLSDRQFIREVEKIAPKNAAIFQFPFMGFPAHFPKLNEEKIFDFDHFRGYLHSATLRWSYGAALGRYPVLWYQLTAESPIDPLLYKLSVVGFTGIYIDRYGYPDNGAQLEAALTARVGGPKVVSANGRLCYYDLAAYRDQVLRRIPSDQWAAMQDLVLYPVQADWTGGFSALEGEGSSPWRWCGADGQLNLINHARRDRMVRLVMEFYPDQPEGYEVVVWGTGFSDTVSVAEGVRRYERVVALPAGGTASIYFHSDAPPLDMANDTRSLVFAIHNFELDDALYSNTPTDVK